jgi:surface polysaccharide O-acyltransferase-like enzyme
MKEKTQDRQSNFELMRIVSMFLIVIYHIIMHANILNNTVGSIHVIIQFIIILCCVHVNSFVLITGYFQCEKKMHFNKVISLINSMWFYKVVIVSIFIIFDIMQIDPIKRMLSFLPINYGMDEYWFVGCYLILYLISPILNTVVNNISKVKLKKILLLLFFVCCILSTFTSNVAFNDLGGHSITQFIFLYFVGAYLKKYPLNKKELFHSPSLLRLISFVLIFVFAIFKLCITLSGEKIANYGTIASYFGNLMIGNIWIDFDTPLIVFESIAYFIFFNNLDISSKLINRLSKYMIGVYLIHDNYYIRETIYFRLFKFLKITIYSKSIFLKIFIVAIIIFLVCMFIEALRQLLFKFIYNMKWAKKFRDWYQNRIEMLGITINW